MTFTEKDKLKALAIVNIFETGKPFGDYAACVVLNDGAGVSYGINQFTHRSGSLAAVVRTYLRFGGSVGRETLAAKLPSLTDRSAGAVAELSRDERFKRALRTAAATGEMQLAQRRVAEQRYLQPAIETCERMGFVTPLAMAVVYDSINHGSWDWISARVKASVPTVYRDPLIFEKSWITEYVRLRHRWLTEVKRLRATNYRTRFFLNQIAISNWTLALPLTVHGTRLTSEHLNPPPMIAEAAEPAFPVSDETRASTGSDAPRPEPSITEKASEIAAKAMSGFDRIDGAFDTVARRSDSAKSMWTTIAGSASQAVWAVFGFLIGLPRTVWIVVATIAAALTVLYLYRQITLGKIRELRE